VEASDNLIWLSHMLAEETPVYAGGENRFKAIPNKQICHGDSCNTVDLCFSNHLGTHVDAPYHFISNGKKITDYSPSEWVFHTCQLVEIPVEENEVVTVERLLKVKKFLTIDDVDFLILKTGFELWRKEDKYWKNSPGYSPELASFLCDRFPGFKAIGFDSISLSGFQHRELGRAAHREFLSRGIRIFEDMKLSELDGGSRLKKVYAFPLCFSEADGAPCTIMGKLEHIKKDL
jgi:kynurenine formamidase